MTTSVRAAEAPEKAQPVTCRHHWIIEPAKGPVSRGVCRLCSQEKEFKNYIEPTSQWDEPMGRRQIHGFRAMNHLDVARAA